jgi:DNA-binding transcriptional ArsR family regulator
MDGEDLAELLRLRHDLLRALAADPRPRHELVDAVPDSKSTVYKGLSQLREAGFVRREEAGFAPTLFGVLALARYDALAGTAAFGDLLADLPGGTVAPDALVGAEVVRPDETDAERHLGPSGGCSRGPGASAAWPRWCRRATSSGSGRPSTGD